MSARPKPGDMLAFRDGWSKAKQQPTLIGLLHRWSGRDDAHLVVIVLDKRGRPLPPYRLYADQVVVLEGYEELRQQTITALATTRRGRKAAAAAETDETPAAPDPHRPTQRGQLDMHDVPYRVADIESDYDPESNTSARGWNRDVDRYLDRGGRVRDWLRRMREEQPKNFTMHSALAHGPRRAPSQDKDDTKRQDQKSAPITPGLRRQVSVRDLMAGQKPLEKGEPKP